MLNNHMKRYLREPLLHFLLIDASIYALYTAVGARTTDDERSVTVTAEKVAVIADQFEQAWRRPPTGDEFDCLVDKHADVQVLYREALAIRLDKGDYVIVKTAGVKNSNFWRQV